MSEYTSNSTLEQVAERLGSAQRLLLTTHVKPDGDGMGSALAMARALEAHGGDQRADIFLMGPVEPRLEVIASGTPYRLVEKERPGNDYDVVVVKSPNGFRTYYESIAERIVPVDVPGSTSANLKSLPFKNCVRPIFPLDDAVVGPFEGDE